ncbi:MAG: hypothetical protein JOZ54_21645 [Acidobacteria bacterium]|nr:hypothetical protein [Acidobacteriota bacterium]
MNKNAVVAGLVLVVTFGVGALAGFFGDRYYLKQNPPPPPPRRTPAEIVERLDKKLHFTTEQRTAVLQILKARDERINGLWSTVRPRVWQEMESSNAEIERLLTPGQKPEFEKIRAKLRTRERESRTRVR